METELFGKKPYHLKKNVLTQKKKSTEKIKKIKEKKGNKKKENELYQF